MYVEINAIPLSCTSSLIKSNNKNVKSIRYNKCVVQIMHSPSGPQKTRLVCVNKIKWMHSQKCSWRVMKSRATNVLVCNYINAIFASEITRNSLMTRPLHWNDIITHEHDAADGTGEFADRNESVWTEGWCASVPCARASVSFVMQTRGASFMNYVCAQWVINTSRIQLSHMSWAHGRLIYTFN